MSEPQMPFIPGDKVVSEVETKEPVMPFAAEESEPEPPSKKATSKESQSK